MLLTSIFNIFLYRKPWLEFIAQKCTIHLKMWASTDFQIIKRILRDLKNGYYLVEIKYCNFEFQVFSTITVEFVQVIFWQKTLASFEGLLKTFIPSLQIPRIYFMNWDNFSENVPDPILTKVDVDHDESEQFFGTKTSSSKLNKLHFDRNFTDNL